MKKIVALVLALVMVMGLATTAFAAADEYDLYKADDSMAVAMKLGATAAAAAGMDVKTGLTIDEVAAKTNSDGSGNVAYLKVEGGLYATKTTAPTVSSYAVCEEGETDVLYYVNISDATSELQFAYVMEVTAFTNWGLKCGQVDNVKNTIDATKDYFYCPKTLMVHMAKDPVAQKDANWLLDGEVVSGGAGMAPIDHSFFANDYKYDATLKVNLPTSAICTTCLETSTAIYKVGKAPAGSTVKDLTVDGKTGTWVVVPGVVASTPVVDTEKVESAETFDAGIAMYVGMSVMAAAGSAVVLKKKD